MTPRTTDTIPENIAAEDADADADADAVVIGAGVVGLAVARALALAGREVLLLEAEAGIGSGISSRNSEVIHAGLYYPAGSMKARLCGAGNARLYAFCAEHGVAHRRCGKLVVATNATQLGALHALHAQALANGVHDAELLSGAAARALEPALHAVAALWSPATGIVDSHALMLALLADAERHSALLALRSPVLSARCGAGGMTLNVGGEVGAAGAVSMRLRARSVVNACGLQGPALAARFAGLPAAWVPRAWQCKGSYFALAGRAPFSRLVYPLPDPADAAGLGVHLTLDLAGQARFGPDTEWLDDAVEVGAPSAAAAPDYAVDPVRSEAFYAAIRRYWPALPDGALRPAYAGIRPKISGPGAAAADFMLSGPRQHGVPGLVNLFGIESPGLTAALALADEVCAALG